MCLVIDNTSSDVISSKEQNVISEPVEYEFESIYPNRRMMEMLEGVQPPSVLGSVSGNTETETKKNKKRKIHNFFFRKP